MSGAPDREARLEALRRRIRNLDAALLGLMSERMELAREVGETKRRLGIPLRDYEVERRVLDRSAKAAEELGLSHEIAHAVMGHLIEEACRIQEEEHFTGVAADAETILIVGALGKMGRWFTRFLMNQGHHVRTLDLVDGEIDGERAESLEAGLDGASIALVAVSLAEVGSTIERIAATGYRGVICDIASLKEHLRLPIGRATAGGARVTSIHPMFGPRARTLSDKVVCLCDCGDAAATEKIAALFRETAVRLVPLSLAEHDRIAAFVLGLSHFVNLLFVRVLERSGNSLAELATVGSTTFQSQIATAASVLRENASLYYSIQKFNPGSPDLYRQVEAAVADWARWIESGDFEGFAAAMDQGGRWLEGTPDD
jgi:chorismate mutase/prephenate dehydrogenase